ncbi:hypothetical protein XF_1352 [Xylella fastidiosa 9a5c]|uniref:Uncharacterized protein n=1 Tax=Xylella fastidiosa (strain 9a5c) TaxID=160492 RepID=Q9PDM7_XYLFA|nr:hypothetical protein XF_1352 [Xylella fastidiosa 9a5c]
MKCGFRFLSWHQIVMHYINYQDRKNYFQRVVGSELSCLACYVCIAYYQTSWQWWFMG